MNVPACSSPGEMPDFRLWLAEQWAPGRPFANAGAHAMTARIHGSAFGSLASLAANYARWEHSTLRSATLWWVGEDMVDLLIATARGVPDDVRFAEMQSPAASGLIVFAKPWLGLDSITPGHKVEVDALLWGSTLFDPSVRPGAAPEGLACCSASAYRRIAFDEGLSASELEIAAATGAIAYGQVVDSTVRPGEVGRDPSGPRPLAALDRSHGEPGTLTEVVIEPGQPVRRFVGRAWVPLGRSDWPVVDRIADRPYDEMTPEAFASYVEDRKVLAAFWTLMHQQGIASRVERRAERPAARRTLRAGLPAAASNVQVVTLRKLEHTVSDPGEARPVEHDHRWLVSGHWRWQPFGPGRSERRLQFIAPYVKGPEDKPLRTKDRVNAFIR